MHIMVVSFCTAIVSAYMSSEVAMHVSQNSYVFVRIVKIMNLLFFLILCSQTVSKPSKDYHRVLPMSIDPAFNLPVTEKNGK